MIKRLLILGLCTLALLPASAWAQEGGKLMSVQTNVRNPAELQRGARLFFNYCVGCHSLHYERYSRMARDLGLSKDEVMNNLDFTGAKFQQHIISSMPADGAKKWFGKAPPDLSLEVRAKGGDWVYSYLNSFYLDPSRPVGWNNTVFPNASMPFPLWKLQGIQVPVYGVKQPGDDHAPIDHLTLKQDGLMNEDQYHQATRDLVAFLQYVSEPVALTRHRMGIWVILFLAFFTLLAWLLKREYWKDIH